MFEPSEKAIDLYKRVYGEKFVATWNHGNNQKTETFVLGEFIEIQASIGNVPFAVLDLMMQFAESYHNKKGLIIHISIANLLQTSLKISKFQVSSNLKKMNDEGNVKSINIQNIVQLIAILTILTNTLLDEKCLLIFEGLNQILISQKGTNESLPSTSLVHEMLQLITYLKENHFVLGFWIDTSNTREKGGLREGHPRDPLSILWKNKVSKHINYAPI